MKLQFLAAALFLPAASLFSAGCATSPTTAKLEKIPGRVEKGKSTKSQVRALLGEPDSRLIDSSGETWFYGEEHGREPGEVVVDQAVGVGAGFLPVPYAGTAINSLRSLGRSSRENRPSARVEFDRRGVVRDYQLQLP